MIQEDKELLLKDLCARLPYGVMLSITHNEYTDETFNTRISTIDYCGDVKVRYGFEEYEQTFSLEQIKPYLFPLSSMTEEQKKELNNISWYFDNDTISNSETYYSEDTDYITHTNCCSLIDWLIRNHFDFRGLIEKGLAIDATDKNIY